MICVDFMDAKKSTPRDCFPLPSINQLVYATTGVNLISSFMDAYSGYYQIKMHLEDEEKPSFIIEDGCFFYRRMSFELKNNDATYEHILSRMFKRLLGREMEVYMDEMITKSRKSEEHIGDLEETFGIMRSVFLGSYQGSDWDIWC